MNQKTDYKMIPEQGELAQIQRELRFFLSTTIDPQVLTPERIEAFNRDGYLMRIRIFDEKEADANRRYFDDLLKSVTASGGDSYSISSAHLKYPGVYDLLTHPKIVAVVRDLLGPNVIGWGSHYFCKMPGDGKSVTWHQDASYWPITPSKTVTVWLAIDDAGIDNACMRFIPGSHLHGHAPYQTSQDDEGNVLDQTIVGVEEMGEPVNVILKAGEISVHSDLLIHGSEANNSERRRCGLTLRYCPPDGVAHMDWNLKGVVVSGNEKGTWAGRQRPNGEN